MTTGQAVADGSAAADRAIKAHGSPNVSLPPGPDFHQFAKREIAEELLSKAGFSNIELSIIDCGWDVSTPESLAEIIEQGTVRAATLLSNPKQSRAAMPLEPGHASGSRAFL